MLASGVLDASFGSGGKLLIPPGFAQGVVVQPDGKFVVLAQGSYAAGNSFTLMRFNADASPDATFGVGGKAAGNLGGMRLVDEEANSLALQSDGKLVVAGIGTGLVNGADNDEFALTRYDASGRLDEENKAIVQGSIAYFGTYTIDESETKINIHYDGSTYPNWDEEDQVRNISISGDELTTISPVSAVGGGTVRLVLRRAR